MTLGSLPAQQFYGFAADPTDMSLLFFPHKESALGKCCSWSFLSLTWGNNRTLAEQNMQAASMVSVLGWDAYCHANGKWICTTFKIIFIYQRGNTFSHWDIINLTPEFPKVQKDPVSPRGIDQSNKFKWQVFACWHNAHQQWISAMGKQILPLSNGYRWKVWGSATDSRLALFAPV